MLMKLKQKKKKNYLQYKINYNIYVGENWKPIWSFCINFFSYYSCSISTL